MKRYFRRNCTSVVLFLVSNLLAAVSSVLMSFLLGLFADSAMEGDLSRVWKIALVLSRYHNGVSQYSHKEYSDAMHPDYALPL